MAKALHFDPSRGKDKGGDNARFVELANKLGDRENRPPTDAIRLLAIEAGTIKLKFPDLYHEFVRKAKDHKKSVAQSA